MKDSINESNKLVLVILGLIVIGALILLGWRVNSIAVGPVKLEPPQSNSESVQDQQLSKNPGELLAGAWSGIISNPDGGFSAELTLFFRSTCNLNDVCGTYDVPSIHCSGNLILVDMNDDSFIFLEQITSSDCAGSGYQHIDKLAGNSISYGYSTSGNPSDIVTRGILEKK